jgi:hypothetical protein
MKSKQLKKTKKIKYKKRKTIRKKQKGRGSTSSKLNMSNDYSSNPVLPQVEKNKSKIDAPNIDAIVAEHVNNNPNEFSTFAAELKDEITFLPTKIVSNVTNNKKLMPYKKQYPELYKLAEKNNQSNKKFLRVGKQKIEIPDSFDILDSKSKEQPPNFGGKNKKGK